MILTFQTPVLLLVKPFVSGSGTQGGTAAWLEPFLRRTTMRKPRIEAAGMPLHVTQRGVDRKDVFRDASDRYGYLNALEVCAARQRVSVHGYVLMSNHVHLLVSADAPGAISRTMQALLAAYVPRFNARWGRSGPLWEGRFRSCVVDTDHYLLNCLAYVELNPVRAGMVQRAEDYGWSSARHHLGEWADPRVTPHPLFVALGPDVDGRASAWRHVLASVADRALSENLREQLRRPACGSAEFQARMGARIFSGPRRTAE
jgi:putative transposase